MKKLKVVFDQPQIALWDGRLREGGEFVMEGGFVPNIEAKWGCYPLKFWFKCYSGCDEDEAVEIAKQTLERFLMIKGTVEILEK